MKYLFWAILANKLYKLKKLVNNMWKYCNGKALYYSPYIRRLFGRYL